MRIEWLREIISIVETFNVIAVVIADEFFFFLKLTVPRNRLAAVAVPATFDGDVVVLAFFILHPFAEGFRRLGLKNLVSASHGAETVECCEGIDIVAPVFRLENPCGGAVHGKDQQTKQFQIDVHDWYCC
mmetsp:Transcript_7969/g.7811  ORF Transcript_7969/g.7811 Transcript_7969/m.7811 type:complete len:130 (+) Transcript_7969:1705-2094(+)